MIFYTHNSVVSYLPRELTSCEDHVRCELVPFTTLHIGEMSCDSVWDVDPSQTTLTYAMILTAPNELYCLGDVGDIHILPPGCRALRLIPVHIELVIELLNLEQHLGSELLRLPRVVLDDVGAVNVNWVFNPGSTCPETLSIPSHLLQELEALVVLVQLRHRTHILCKV